MKSNWFETLVAALDSEGLNDKWPLGLNISYGETVRFVTDDFYLISVYRSDTGRYERPVWYSTITAAARRKMEDQLQAV
jgi:hypothetical protein